MSTPTFVHLRFHSEYSITDGIVRLDPIIHKVLEQGGVALGLSDRMNIFGGLRFYTHALAAGLKPILGCDLQVVNEQALDKPYRLTILCMNHEGYLSLSRLLTKAFLDENDRTRGQVHRHWLHAPEHHQGLICLGGGTDGELAALLLKGNTAAAQTLLNEYLQIFEDRFYIEVERAGRPNDERATALLAGLAAQTQTPIVATHPIQFLNPEDFEAHEVRCCIADGYTLSNPHRPRNYTPEQYLKTPEQMQALFADMPAALTNSVEIAKRCNLDQVLSEPRLPLFPTPDGMSLDDYIDALSKEGLQKRLDFLYPDPEEQAQKRPAYDKRLEYELDIIKGMKFPGYFLIVQDFINWSKRNGIPVGPGRGSGAGSLVAYSLGITDLDPLKFDLLFERFLNPERVSMPDFDVDFCQYNRDRTIDYVKQTYGVEAVSQIATFGTLGAKAVIRDVGRVLDLPYFKTDNLSKLIPQQPGRNISLQEALDEVPEFKQAVENDDEYREILRLARPLEGLTRNLGMHAGGVLIAPGRLTDFCPLYNSDGKPENTVSQFDKKDVENVGLVKFDFLGLTTLSILSKAVEYIDQLHPESKFDLDRIPIDDKKTYKIFQEGQTVAIFQFESENMQKLLRQAKPDCLEDLVALNALYRPGPMDLIPSFIARKFGKEEVEYLDERMAPVLKETYGIMVYQEQVMRVAQVIGGYSLGGADLLRRAMGKKNVEEMKRQRAVFVKGAEEHGVKEDVATKIFDLMEKFAGYGFNKSHAAAYSYVAYQTAYLKAHHPAAFMAANLCMVMDDGEKMKNLINDAKDFDVDLLPPDINQSDWFFTAPDASHIRFGLGGLKGISRQVTDDLIHEREVNGPFKDIYDVAERVASVNQRYLEILVKSGAFDQLNADRGLLFANVTQAIGVAQAKRQNEGQDSLFDSVLSPEETLIEWLAGQKWDLRRQLQEEKNVLGFWLSDHLFNQYVPEVRPYIVKSLAQLTPSRQPIEIAGIVTGIRQIQSKKGPMGIIMIEDNEAGTEVVFYSEAWERVKPIIQLDDLVFITARIRMDDMAGRLSVNGVACTTLEEHRLRSAKSIDITLHRSAKVESIEALSQLMNPYLHPEGLSVNMTLCVDQLRGNIMTECAVKNIESLLIDLRNQPYVESALIRY